MVVVCRSAFAWSCVAGWTVMVWFLVFLMCWVCPPIAWWKALASWNGERLWSDVLVSVLVAVRKVGGVRGGEGED
jgi:hypothetical protein